MSRTHPRQYAAALLDALDATPAAHAGQVMKRFVARLVHDRMLKKAGRVVEEVRAEWNRREGSVDVVVASAYPIAKKTLDAIGVAVQAIVGAQKAQVETREDKALLGGAVIRYGDTRIDGSVKRRLQSLKEHMTQ